MNHIFISYSRKNKKQVAILVEGLRTRGLNIWQDVSGEHGGIPYSVKWFEAIEEAMFTATGAIIFQTKEWEDSAPCSNEYDLIQKLCLSYIVVDGEEFSRNQETVIEEAAAWIQHVCLQVDEESRLWMLEGAYRLYKNQPMDGHYLEGNGFLKSQLQIILCKRIVKEKNYQGEWVTYLKQFLRKARCKVNLRALSIVIVGTLMIGIGVVGIATVGLLQTYRQYGLDMVAESISVEQARIVSESDEMSALRILVSNGRYAEQNAAIVGFYYGQSGILAELLSRNYPEVVYDSVEECPSQPEVEVSEPLHYEISLQTDEAKAFVIDKRNELMKQMSFADIPHMYRLYEEEELLLVAAGSRVYVYDIGGEAEPSLLTGNTKHVEKIWKEEEYIYAVTDTGRVVGWKNPLYSRKLTGRTLAGGELAVSETGSSMAVYVDGQALVVNRENKETCYQIETDGTLNQCLVAVSSDQSCAAVVSNHKERDDLLLVSLKDGKLLGTYDTGGKVQDVIIDSDGALVASDSVAKVLIRIHPDTGETECSKESLECVPAEIVEYQGQYLVGDNESCVTFCDEFLNPIRTSKGRMIPASRRQMAISYELKQLVMAGRGGNVTGGTTSTDLESGKVSVFPTTESEDSITNMTVAVSRAGYHVAFGNPNGTIYLWNLQMRSQMRNIRNITESVIDLEFAEDDTELYALGVSGTIYQIPVGEILDFMELGDARAVWYEQMKQGEEIWLKMKRLELLEQQ